MTAAILSFGRRKPNAVPLPSKMPWQNQDLAELYRVRDRLCSAGLEVEVEGGVSDEGDPWFVYQQAGTDNVVVHIARIDDEIHVINCVTGGAYSGKSFREVSDQMLEDAPLALGSQLRRSNNVVLHPSAFLTAFVAAAIMLVDLIEHGRAEAAETGGHGHGPHDGAPHDAWFAKTAHASEGEGAPAKVESEGSGVEGEADAGDGVLHRRLGKEGPVQSAPGGAPANGNAAASAPVLPAANGHGAFVGELPGSGASFALTAGMFAAELLRVFASEDGDGQAGSGFAGEFSALLTAFVSNDAGLAKGSAAPATDESLSLAEGAEVFGMGDPALSARIDAPSLSGEGFAHAFSVKAAVQTAPESAGLAVELHKMPAQAEKTAPVPPLSAALTSSGAPAAASVETAAPAAHAAEAVQQSAAAPVASASSAASPASSSAGAITAAPAAAAPSASAAAPIVASAAAKDVAADALDLGWVVSQLVKRSGSAVDAALKLAATVDAAAKDAKAVKAVDASDKHGSDKPGEKIVLASAEKTASGDGVAASKTAEKPAETTPVKIADKAAESAHAVSSTVEKAGSVLEGGAGKAAEPLKLPDSVALHAAADGTLAKLVAGRAETVHVVKGATLAIEGFVFGEDALSFPTEVENRMLSAVHTEGRDFVIGDATTGIVRLVGILPEMHAIAHGAGGATS